MTMADRVFVGGGGLDHGEGQHLLLAQGNRHGLIAGATGTGKTVTLQVLAEGFSAAGVPVFLADMKGDLAGLALPGNPSGKLAQAYAERAARIGCELRHTGFPVTFWDIWGQQGHPIRTTVAEMGPLLISRILELGEVQEGVMNILFRIADEEGLPLLDFKDLQAMLRLVATNAAQISATWGQVSPASIGAIQRRLLVLENAGGAKLFGEPALDLADLMLKDERGRGRINILAADRLMHSPRLYATFMLWLLSELFETLPEVGNPDRPNLVFFDEAHLLFDDAPKALIDKVEQVARLIRSKGVGIYFVTQNPTDVPDAVLGQLGNRVQHALRAFTARDQKDLQAAARNYRANPRFDIAEAIRDVGTGEAVTSFLDAKGVPGVVERTLIRPPSAHNGTITPEVRAAVMAASPLAGRYDHELDRDSAYEMLARRADAAAAAAASSTSVGRDQPDQQPRAEQVTYSRGRRLNTSGGGERMSPGRAGSATRRSDSVGETFVKSFARQLGSRSAQGLVRGIMGTLFKSR